MKILSAEFVTSAAGAGGGIPHDGLGQIAAAGRSNVGKSTLLNALMRRKLARTSAAPGKTRLANIFRVTAEGGPGGPGRWSLYFIDLPGYGYARGGDDAAKELAGVAAAYFASSGTGMRDAPAPAGKQFDAGYGEASPKPLRGEGGGADPDPGSRIPGPGNAKRSVLLLVDARHPGLGLDVQAHKWLTTVAGPPQIVATKIDKLSRSERAKNLKALEDVFGSTPLPVSAADGEGLDDLWTLIARVARPTAPKQL